MSNILEPGMSALARHRRRLRDRGFRRVEVHVHNEDAVLIRVLAAALTDPVRSAETRAMLLARFAPSPPPSFKDLLASAPLDGIELTRVRDTGRIVDL